MKKHCAEVRWRRWIVTFMTLMIRSEGILVPRNLDPFKTKCEAQVKTNTIVESAYEKRIIKERMVDIRYVNWAGCRGMLPFQSYRNKMPKREYERWLRKQIPTEWNDLSRCTDHEYQYQHETNRCHKKRKEYNAMNRLDPNVHLNVIYIDSHIVVVDKSSGVLSVPGPKRNPSTANLVHEYFGNEEDDVDSMVIHRLDMDTSGVIIYARSKAALSIMHSAFRNKSEMTDEDSVSKQYEALVCGHVPVYEGEIDIPLVRDKQNPPFMKVFTLQNESDPIDTSYEEDDIPLLSKHDGYIKMISKAPKDSLTFFRVESYEYLDGNPNLPVTRLALFPITGRTHQLRVACASMGHPIVGDTIYGVFGDGSKNGGFTEETISKIYPNRASYELQVAIDHHVRKQQKSSSQHWELCLHAKRLTINHPITGSPMMFSSDAPF